MKSYEVCAVGNGIVDILIEVTEEELVRFGFAKGSMSLVSPQEQRSCLTELGGRKRSLISGGSLANSLIAFAQLGGTGAFITRLGADEFGAHYRREFTELGITVPGELMDGESSGTCLILIAPDAERTMRTSLGASALLGAGHVSEEVVSSAEWVIVEGYLLAAPGYGDDAAFKAVELAKRHGCKVAVGFSALFIVEGFGDALRQVVSQADLIFANREESLAFTGCVDFEEARRCLAGQVPQSVITAGAEGAFVAYDGRQLHVDALPCHPVDLTGAGDVFAGAYLFGITHGLSPKQAALGACRLAKEVICRVGPRIGPQARAIWQAAVSG